jgi:hypothetical protein
MTSPSASDRTAFRRLELCGLTHRCASFAANQLQADVPGDAVTHFAEKLKATPDGDGTLLDHSLIRGMPS